MNAIRLEQRSLERAAVAWGVHVRNDDGLLPRGVVRDVSTGAYSVSRRVSGAPALEHTATGILKSGPVVRWRILTFERNGILYTISTHEESGASDRVREEVRAIVDSFRLLDR